MFKYRVFSGPYFALFGLNTTIYSVNLRTQSKYGEIRTINNPQLDINVAVSGSAEVIVRSHINYSEGKRLIVDV